jgi:mannose-6-phosphate isomerase-like protein (cupin superfamily)
MRDEPVNLGQALDSFDQVWSPRIVATVNDYDVRVAKAAGEHVWHVHETTDEFFLVLDGELRIALRRAGTAREVVLPAGSVYVVPRGVEHRPTSPTGARLLLLEPSGTSTVGERHAEIPASVDVTTGHAWERPASGS